MYFPLTYSYRSFFFLQNCEKENPVNPPKVRTLPVKEFQKNIAQSGGNIMDNGGTPVTDRGVVWI